MWDKKADELSAKEAKQELRALYGVGDFSDCLTLEDLQKKLSVIRNSKPITHGLEYGPLIQHGNTNSPSGVVFLSHGLGDSANGWDDVGHFLASRLPHLLFLLPTAPMRGVTINGGSKMPAWYDILSLIGGGIRTTPQDGKGVLQSSDYLASYAHVVSQRYKFPPQRVVYAGFSQGAAISLVTGLIAKTAPAGIVAMSGYLAGYSAVAPLMRNRCPIAMFHGTMDPVVPITAAQETMGIIKDALGTEVEMSEYPMQHTAVQPELDAVLKFVSRVLPAEY